MNEIRKIYSFSLFNARSHKYFLYNFKAKYEFFSKNVPWGWTFSTKVGSISKVDAVFPAILELYLAEE